jgi:MSHA pilin protein MshD
MCRRANRGVTLVELIVFIVIVGVAMAGLFAAFNTITAASADPQVRKQALAIAESLMDEVALMPFTYCDPDDALAPTAGSSGACGTPEVIGVEGGETRYDPPGPRFDNVSDYNGFAMSSGIKDINEVAITGLGAYSASISVANAGTELGLAANDEALRITVTVTGPGSVSTTLEGYRTRYAPNTLP